MGHSSLVLVMAVLVMVGAPAAGTLSLLQPRGHRASIALAVLIGSIELVSILHDDLNWSDPITSWVSGIDLNNAGLAVVALFAVTWIAAIAYWKLANVEARHQVVEPAE